MKLLPKRKDLWPRNVSDEKARRIEEAEKRYAASVFVFDNECEKLLEVWYRDGRKVKVT